MLLSSPLSLIFSFIILNFVCGDATYTTAPFYKATKLADIDHPRGLFVDDSGDILVVSATTPHRIYALTEVEGETYVIVNAEDLRINHGIALHGGYIYASSASAVYRWPYVAGSRKLVTTQPETVINNIPTAGHASRTILFDSESQLYVHIGSNENVDLNSDRARIRRFNINSVQFPHDFNTGEIFADGLRNEVGLAFDSYGDLWGVENGADSLVRPDLGGDIHNGNPGEELNRFNQPIGSHYGYPYCFSTDALRGYERGTQFAWPRFMNDGVHTDAWCRDINNNIPPTFVLPAHTAPLGIEFYSNTDCNTVEPANGTFPCSTQGDAFVSFHGSWNSDLKVGYHVSQIVFSKTAPFTPTGEIINIIYETDLAGCGSRCFRPVNAVFTHRGHLIVSADANDEIIRVTYDPLGSSSHKLTFSTLFIFAILAKVVFTFV